MAKKPTIDNDKLDALRNEVQDLAISINTESNNSANLKETVEKLEAKVDGLADKLELNKDAIIAGVKDEFVKYVEFRPVKAFVYGLIGIICTVVILGLLTLVIAPYVQHRQQNSPTNLMMPTQ